MVLLTMIARVADGLPLAASMQEDEQSGRDLQQYQSQAKQLFRKLNEQSPTRCTLEAGAMTFHYIIEQGVCYLVLCEAAFPKKLAFAYLEDLHSEFDEQHGKKVPTVSRPYSFIEFDTYIQKTKKLYIDSRARRNLGSINTELQDVQRIMVANIEEVLQRGEALSGIIMPPSQSYCENSVRKCDEHLAHRRCSVNMKSLSPEEEHTALDKSWGQVCKTGNSWVCQMRD
uniref:SEC22 homolog B, vesicle trafficking protein n=1 Tax=Equus caballus TaxID=9796 RepID=F7ATC8_HORSE